MILLMKSDAPSGERQSWQAQLPTSLVKGLCGIIAIIVAIKAAGYTPDEPQVFLHQEHFFRVLAFAALTIWTALAIGHQRRGAAAMITLSFAVFVELFLIPARDAGVPSIIAANLGIVLAWSALQLYCVSQDEAPQS